MIVRRRSPINGRRQRPVIVTPVRLDEVIEQVAFESEIGAVELAGSGRRALLIEMRSAVAWLGYTRTEASIADIAATIGRRFDATTYDYLAKAEQLLALDADFRAFVDRIGVALEAAA